jgi:dethiobiotin synthetase
MNYFVTGTDTGVGKTLISCAMLHAFAARGKLVVGMKPVAAGCNAERRNEDALQLMASGNATTVYEHINPYCFLQPIAPHIAARLDGVEIQFAHIVESYKKLDALADVVIVEGAGGLLVPLNEQRDNADLVRELGLPVIMVTGVRLGCLNHALLTVEAIAARGLTLSAWVANIVDADMPFAEENILSLQQRIAAPMLGVVPYLPQADARIVAGLLHLESLGS